LVLGLGVGLMGCGGDDDDENISGVFQGTVVDSGTGQQGSIIVNLFQSGNSLTGSYTTLFGAIGASNIGNGDLSGVINGSTVSLTATSSTSRCVFVVNATVDDDDLDGTFLSTSGPCQGGTFNTSRP
jgi:hypothetical protein